MIDPACSVVFEAEQGPPDLMEQPPRSTRETMLSMTQVLHSLAYGGLTTLMVFQFYRWMLEQGSAGMAGAASFVMLVTANAVLILPARTAARHWTLNWLKLTPTTLWVLTFTALGLLLATSWPPLASAFRFAPLSAGQWLFSFALGLLMLPVFMLAKRLIRQA